MVEHQDGPIGDVVTLPRMRRDRCAARQWWPLAVLVPVEVYLVFLHPVGLAVSRLNSGSFPIGPLDPAVGISQTFSRRANGLREVQVYPLVTGDPAGGHLVVELHLGQA